MMRKRIPAWFPLWIACLVFQAAPGRAAASSYGEITASNVFRLKTPESQPAATPPPVMASIRLTGITTLLPHKLAFLKVRPPAGASEPAQELALSLQEGQRERGIEVLTIDEKAGRVELLNAGTRMVVAFGTEPPPSPVAPRTGRRQMPLRMTAEIPNP